MGINYTVSTTIKKDKGEIMSEIKLMSDLTPNQYILLKYIEIKGKEKWEKVYDRIGMSKNTYYSCIKVLKEKKLL